MAELEALSGSPEFWNDMDKAQRTLQKLKGLKNIVEQYNKLCGSYEDVMTLIEMAKEEEDEDLASEAQAEADTFVDGYEQMRIATLLDG
ncbi:MAG: PCRF domain-containing protein, partial [Niameybacter sp.]